MTQFLYHLSPPDLRDGTVYPLNDLRTRHPDLYEREVQKWDGRESVPALPIPHLGCSWGDTVNLSTLHPRRLVERRMKLGLPMSHLLDRRVVEIPVDRLEGREAVWYASSSHWVNSCPGDLHAAAAPPIEDFALLELDRYRELTDVPEAHDRYLRAQRDAGAPALGFVFVPHVLVRGPIELVPA